AHKCVNQECMKCKCTEPECGCAPGQFCTNQGACKPIGDESGGLPLCTDASGRNLCGTKVPILGNNGKQAGTTGCNCALNNPQLSCSDSKNVSGFCVCTPLKPTDAACSGQCGKSIPDGCGGTVACACANNGAACNQDDDCASHFCGKYKTCTITR